MTGFVVQGHIFGTTEDLYQLKKTEQGVTADLVYIGPYRKYSIL